MTYGSGDFYSPFSDPYRVPFSDPYRGEEWTFGGNSDIPLELLLNALLTLAQLRQSPDYMANRDQNVYLATKALADYVAAEKIADIVFLDRSARPVRAGLSEYLTLTGQPKPDMHFINPEKFEPKTKNTFLSTIKRGTNYRSGRRELEQSKNSLLTHKNDPVLVFDACMHSGDTAGQIQDFLTDSGFQDVRVGAFSVGSNQGTKCNIDVDFQFTNDPTLLYCRPYGLDSILYKSPDSIYVSPQESILGARQIAQNRENARRVIQEQHRLHTM